MSVVGLLVASDGSRADVVTDTRVCLPGAPPTFAAKVEHLPQVAGAMFVSGPCLVGLHLRHALDLTPGLDTVEAAAALGAYHLPGLCAEARRHGDDGLGAAVVLVGRSRDGSGLRAFVAR